MSDKPPALSDAEQRSLGLLAGRPDGVRPSEVGLVLTGGNRKGGGTLSSQALGRIGSRMIARLRGRGWVEARSSDRDRRHYLTDAGRVAFEDATRLVYAVVQAYSSSEHADTLHFCLEATPAALRRLDELQAQLLGGGVGPHVTSAGLLMPDGLNVFVHDDVPAIDPDDEGDREDGCWVPLKDGATHMMEHRLKAQDDEVAMVLHPPGRWMFTMDIYVKHTGSEEHYTPSVTTETLRKLR